MRHTTTVLFLNRSFFGPSMGALLFLVFLNIPLRAQEVYEPAIVSVVQFYTGYESFTNDDAFFAVTTGGDIDFSPNGTRLIFDQVAHDYVSTIGLRIGMKEVRDRSQFCHNLFFDCLTNAFTGPLYMIKAGANYEPEYHRQGTPLSAFLGVGVGISHIWGTLGAVGDGLGDEYLETYDGGIYPKGSSFSMRSNVLPYASVYFGVRWYFEGFNSFYAMAGYQTSHSADIWHYRILNTDDAEDVYEFPDSPFPRSPHAVDQDGMFFRIGISFGGIVTHGSDDEDMEEEEYE